MRRKLLCYRMGEIAREVKREVTGPELSFLNQTSFKPFKT